MSSADNQLENCYQSNSHIHFCSSNDTSEPGLIWVIKAAAFIIKQRFQYRQINTRATRAFLSFAHIHGHFSLKTWKMVDTNNVPVGF